MFKVDKKLMLIICTLALLSSSIEVQAQFLKNIKKAKVINPKISGYIIGQYTATDQEESCNDGGFDVKQARLSFDNRIMDFSFKMQIDVSKVTDGGITDRKVRLLDAFVEWNKYKEFKIKFGEFHRCFSFENPYNPWDIGFDNNSQIINKFVGGRDVGLQFQGEFLPNKNDVNLLGYSVGIFNGQGMNYDDKNKKRDIMGGITFQPIEKLYLGTFAWKGSYHSSDGNNHNIKKHSIGLKYENDWTVRSEYITSKTDNKTSDGWYALVGIPILNNLKIYGKWDVYREKKDMSDAISIYELSGNYYLCKNIKFQLDYCYTIKGKSYLHDRHYNTLIANLYYKF